MRYIKGRETYKITPHYFSFCFPIYRTPPRSEHTYFNSDYPLAELKTLIICGQGDKTWIRKSITGRSSIWMDNESKIRLRAEGSSSHHFPQIKTVLQVTESHSVVSSSLRPPGLCSPWNSLGQNTGVGSLSPLQEIFQPMDQTQVSHITGGCFTSWATGEAQEYWIGKSVPSPVDLPESGI